MPGQNLSVEEKWLTEPTLALLSGISLERGQEHYRIFPKSVNTEKFHEYLTELRALNSNGADKIALFMDNLRVHVSSTDKMKELGFRHIFNLTYSPEYNPIEFTFFKLKSKFKALRAKKLTGLIQHSHESLID